MSNLEVKILTLGKDFMDECSEVSSLNDLTILIFLSPKLLLLSTFLSFLFFTYHWVYCNSPPIGLYLLFTQVPAIFLKCRMKHAESA